MKSSTQAVHVTQAENMLIQQCMSESTEKQYVKQNWINNAPRVINNRRDNEHEQPEMK
jgi:hypothetical protein